MNSRNVHLWFLTMMLCAGCYAPRSTSTGVTPLLVAFSDQEIKSRNWVAPYGGPIKFSDWSTVKARDGNELVIAKYGELNNGPVTCLDIYRVMPRVPPSQGVDYILLAHDYSPSAVVSVEPHVAGRKGALVSIKVVRETNIAGQSRRVRHSYWLDYVGDFAMQAVPLNNILEEVAAPSSTRKAGQTPTEQR